MFGAYPHQYSPYSPSSRLFLNVLHAAPGAILGERPVQLGIQTCDLGRERERLEQLELIDWPAVALSRQRLLRQLFEDFNRGGNAQQVDFDSFRASGGEALENHCRFEALHDHIVFRPGQQPPSHERDSGQVAMRELQTVRIYAPSDGANYYITDISVNLNCIEKPVRLLEYRYGGLGWRATEQWTKENSRVLTSEGKTRKEADGSKARWCIVEGTVDGENAGV